MSDHNLESILATYGKPSDDLVGKLPRVTCKACSDSQSRVCGQHSKSKCKECGNYMTSAHLHLDYMGHAEVTRALIEIDPEWSWEPCAWDADGGPAIRHNGADLELWGRLTVLGVSRLGCGSVGAKTADAGKQLIGDFLRNAAMRFGIALSLWSKSEWEDHADDTPPKPEPTDEVKRLVKQVQTLYSILGVDDNAVRKARSALIVGHPVDSHNDLDAPDLRAVVSFLQAEHDNAEAEEIVEGEVLEDSLPPEAEVALPLADAVAEVVNDAELKALRQQSMKAITSVPTRFKQAFHEWRKQQGIPAAAMEQTAEQARAILARIPEGFDTP